jgi:UDP-N-acetyl-D-galactosamine dehydrogenase
MNINSIKIGIVGLGYVGLPLAVEFSKKYEVIGFDIDKKRIDELSIFNDKTLECSEVVLRNAKKLKFSSDTFDLLKCNIYIVTVPTPIDKFKIPDLHPLLSATKMLGKIIKKNDIVIYESTVYPGCTEEDCVPVLEYESGLIYNVDFFCGYSPERINPGDKINTLTKIKKVTSGSNSTISLFIDKLYNSIILAGTFRASSIKVAEASKAIENAQRDINISFINELALIFDRMNIDTTEVLEAASSKWNFLNYKPGLVGGHCIGVDPYYLSFKSESLGYSPEVILSGRKVNDKMGKFIASKVIKLMIQKNIPIVKSRVLILGITFKENCPDTRNSKVIDIYNELLEYGIIVDVYDPYADNLIVKRDYNVNLTNKLEKYDGIILAVAHDEFKDLNYNNLRKNKISIIYDVKSVLDKNIIDARL